MPAALESAVPNAPVTGHVLSFVVNERDMQTVERLSHLSRERVVATEYLVLGSLKLATQCQSVSNNRARHISTCCSGDGEELDPLLLKMECVVEGSRLPWTVTAEGAAFEDLYESVRSSLAAASEQSVCVVLESLTSLLLQGAPHQVRRCRKLSFEKSPLRRIQSFAL